MNNHVITTPQDRRETLETDLHLQADLMLRLTRDLMAARRTRDYVGITNITQREVPKHLKRVEQVLSAVKVYRHPNYLDRFPEDTLVDYLSAATELTNLAEKPAPVPERSFQMQWRPVAGAFAA